MTDDAYRFRAYSGGCQCGAVRFHATELQARRRSIGEVLSRTTSD